MVSSSRALGSQEDQVPLKTLRLVGGAAASPGGRAHSVGLPPPMWKPPAPCAPALASRPHPPSPGPASPWDPGQRQRQTRLRRGGRGHGDRAPTSPGAAGQTSSPPARLLHIPEGSCDAAPGFLPRTGPSPKAREQRLPPPGTSTWGRRGPPGPRLRGKRDVRFFLTLEFQTRTFPRLPGL